MLGDIGTYENYAFCLAGASGAIAAGLAGGADVFQLRNNIGSAIAPRRIRILKVSINAAVGATGFTAGAALFSLFKATAYTADGSGGTTLTPSSGSNRLRTKNQNVSLLQTGGSMRIINTAALTAGTRTLDAQAMGNIVAPAGAAGTLMVADIPLYADYTSIYGIPFVLDFQEGFVIQATVPATGVWQLGVNVSWCEVDGGAIG